jgi:Na+-transporting NADH:ubiquinone oxidoreductase subunit NqrD
LHKRLSTEARKYFFATIFLSKIQKNSEVLIIKKIMIIARLVSQISQFFKNFSFFFAVLARSRAIGSAVILPEIVSKKGKK